MTHDSRQVIFNERCRIVYSSQEFRFLSQTYGFVLHSIRQLSGLPAVRYEICVCVVNRMVTVSTSFIETLKPRSGVFAVHKRHFTCTFPCTQQSGSIADRFVEIVLNGKNTLPSLSPCVKIKPCFPPPASMSRDLSMPCEQPTPMSRDFESSCRRHVTAVYWCLD